MQQKNYSQAILDYSKTIELSPNDPDAYYHRGLAYFRLSQRDESIKDFQTALRFHPSMVDHPYH